MNRKLLLIPVFLATLVGLLVMSIGLAVGQGPILTTLPTPTPLSSSEEPHLSADQLSATALPDLVVSKIEVEPAVPLVGEETLISVTIKNQGSAPLNVNNNFLTDLYIDPPFVPQVNYHQIVSPTLGLPWGGQWFFVPPGTSHTFTTTWVFTDVQTYEIWAQVDSNGTQNTGDVQEANEDNNTKQINVNVLTTHNYNQDTHQDFLINMASTLDNSDPSGKLRLGRFVEPPFIERPFADLPACEITSVTTQDYEMQSPDIRLNEVSTGLQTNPQIITNGQAVVIAVWEDGRNGEIFDRDIFLRMSTNNGLTWEPEIRVNDDPAGTNQRNPIVALSENGDLLVGWQDFRNGNFDIYAQHYVLSGSNLTPQGPNLLVANDNIGQEQINPDVAVDESGNFHFVWQDKRNGNYDIFATSYISKTGSFTWTEVRRVNDDALGTQQSNPAINVIDWLQVTDIDFTEGPPPDYEVSNVRVISESIRALAIVWEDYRNGNADIAITVSSDNGETFAFDDFINSDALDPNVDPPDAGAPDQLDPDVILTKNWIIANVSLSLSNGSTTDVEVEMPVADLHTVWQDYRNGTAESPNADIYYAQSQFRTHQVDNFFVPKLTVGSNEQLNQNDNRSWQTDPVDQRNPALSAVPCGTGASEEDWNVFMTWADNRNYDDGNFDIYYTLRSDCGGSLQNEMLNDGIRLHQFDSANPNFSDYDPGHPPPGRQVNPGIAADIQLEGSTISGGYLYLVWEDDRAGDPQANKDIFFSRSNLTYYNQANPYGSEYGAGSQISSILDSGETDTTWFTIVWSAATDDSTYVTVQTRLGDTVTDILNSDWYPQDYPFQPQPGACDNPGNDAFDSGAPIQGYDAPGQHIEDQFGNLLPQARYIQYRINFYTRDETKTPELDSLKIYYDPPGSFVIGGDSIKIYLPLVLK
ncbi:MAG: CARDB domain-containing protein [Anaerolineae bacterium]|nr:CARDB domain-containing protein [Anaerolineae bacterium]